MLIYNFCKIKNKKLKNNYKTRNYLQMIIVKFFKISNIKLKILIFLKINKNKKMKIIKIKNK